MDSFGLQKLPRSKERDYVCLDGVKMSSKIKLLDSVREQKISYEMIKASISRKLST